MPTSDTNAVPPGRMRWSAVGACVWVPITELAIVSNFGGLEHWKVLKTQELFAREVMPAFR